MGHQRKLKYSVFGTLSSLVTGTPDMSRLATYSILKYTATIYKTRTGNVAGLHSVRSLSTTKVADTLVILI